MRPHDHATTTLRRRPLDATTWNQLRAQDFRLLDHLAFLSRLTAKRSPANAHYCTPGRAWLADRLGCSLRTVSRTTARLARLGVLQVQQRRPRNGNWSTNLYRIIHRSGWRAAAFAQQIRALAHRATRPARLASPVREKNINRRPENDLRTIIARGMAKFAPT